MLQRSPASMRRRRPGQVVLVGQVSQVVVQVLTRRRVVPGLGLQVTVVPLPATSTTKTVRPPALRAHPRCVPATPDMGDTLTATATGLGANKGCTSTETETETETELGANKGAPACHSKLGAANYPPA